MHNSCEALFSYVLDRIDAEPLALRVKLYRALAEIAPIPAESKRLADLASELEQIERKHQQLVLDFKRRAL